MLQRAVMKRDSLCRIITSKRPQRMISVLAGVWRSIVSSLSTCALHQHLRLLFFSFAQWEAFLLCSLCLHVFCSLHIQCVHAAVSSSLLIVHVFARYKCCFFMFCVIKESSWFQQKILHWLLSPTDQICIDQSHTTVGRSTFQFSSVHADLLLIFPNTSFKLPNSDEMHIL